jgi:hypothetical protein
MTLALLALTLALPFSAAAQTRDAAKVQELRTRGDQLRGKGDYDAALAAYEEQRAAGGDTADVWKHIGWTQKALRRFAAAAASLQRAVELDPQDQEAKDDLENLKISRGLNLRTWVGGTEPGTSKNAFEGQATYGGMNRLELQGGGSWTDNIFYEAVKGYGSAYWFYAPDSYVKGDFTLRKYTYSGANRPTPDSNAYGLVPRADLEISHWIKQRVRVGADYQLFAPNFFFDTGTRVVNHKFSTEAEARLGGGFTASFMAAVLHDPDPKETKIVGRPDPVAPATIVTATSVGFRNEALFGGGLAYEAARWGAGARVIPNRDLDSGFDWSTISNITVQPVDKLSLDFEWVLDRYSTDSGPVFAGKNGNIWWGTARYQFSPQVALTTGLKWVNNPSPKTTTTLTANGVPNESRNDPTLLLNLEIRTGLF